MQRENNEEKECEIPDCKCRRERGTVPVHTNENTQHKPMCKINTQCFVIHPDGVCPGPCGKCDCKESSGATFEQKHDHTEPSFEWEKELAENINPAFLMAATNGFGWDLKAMTDFVHKVHSLGKKEGYAKGREDEASDHLTKDLNAYEEGKKEGAAEERERVLQLIDLHDPSTNRDTNPRYWGKTLRTAIEGKDV